MAVLDRSYRRWEGRPTPYWRRMLVIPSYALLDLLGRKRVLVLLVLMLVPCLGLASAVYLSVNMETIRRLVPVLGEMPSFSIGKEMYGIFWRIQVSMACIFALFAGPPLISRDLAHDALPLYLSKALRRWDYVLGKALVLVVLIACVSWLPLSLIFAWHWSMAPASWRLEQGGIGFSLFASSSVLITVIAAIILAVSSHVRRTRLARITLFALFFMSMAFAGALAGATGSDSFLAVSPVLMIERVGEWAFGAEFFSQRTGTTIGDNVPVSLGLALASLGLWFGAALVVIGRKVRPVEVMR